MQKFELNAQRRTDKGTGASRRLRRNGQVPAILYGADQTPTPITLSHREFFKSLEAEAFYSQIITLNLDGQTERAVLKALQRHPTGPFVLHADFQRVSETQKLIVHIPLHFINEDRCMGVKQGGGLVSHHIIEVEIRALPKDLPEFIEVDIQNLQLNDIIHLSDLVLPEGIELVELTHGDPDHDVAVVSIQPPRGSGAEESEISELP